MLPDSNVNEPASHGFVKFRIKQRPYNPVGSVIYNSAAIYFDYNEPVITNSVFHTIGEDFITVDLWGDPNRATENARPPAFKVFPNPADETATFVLTENTNMQQPVFSIFDAFGKLIRSSQVKNGRHQFQRGNLAAGVYFFKIENEGRLIGSGRIVLK
jgi:hypothetical protein